MTFLQKLQSSQGELVYLVRGKYNGHEVWHYLLVDKTKLPIFQKVIKGGSLDIVDYGKVLRSGLGKNPPNEAIEEIKKQFS